MLKIRSFLEQRSLTQRLLIGFAAIILVVVAVGLQGLQSLGVVRAELRSLYEVELRSLSELKEAQLRLARVAYGLRQAILETSNTGRESAVRDVQQWTALTDASLDEVRRRLPGADGELLRKFEVAHAAYRRRVEQVIGLIQVNQPEQAQALVASAAFLDVGRSASDTLAQLALVNEQRAKNTVDSMDADTRFSAWLATALLGVGVLISLLVAYQVSYSIQRPIMRLRHAIDELAKGRLDEVVPHADYNNELGSLARSLMVLQGKAQALESEGWVKSQVADISSQLQRMHSTEAVCQCFVDMATPRLRAALACVYLVDTDRGTLRLGASYALPPGAVEARGAVRIGEGLVGRCAQSAQGISVDNLPEDYAVISSGTGSASATHLELRAVGHVGQLKAVVEFASFGAMPRDAQALLDALLPLLAINLEILDRTQKTEALLAQAQRHEETLRRTEAWFRGIIESAPDGMLVVDNTGVIRLANASAATMFGYGSAELVGMAVDRLVPSAVRGGHGALRAGYLASGGTRQMGADNFNLRASRRHGTEFPVEVGLAKLPDREGKGPMVCVSVRDVTERKREERALARQRATMQQVLDNSPIGMVIEAGGRLRYVNPEFARLFDVETGDPADKTGVTADARRDITQRLRAGESMRNVEFKKKKSDGEVGHFLATFALIDHEGEEGTIGWVADISDRARVEQLKKEFISTVSHELRTPLTSIRGSLALVVNGVVGQLPDAAKPLVQIAHSNCERLILLVNDILDMEKLEAGRMDFDIQQHALMPLIQQAVDANRPYAQQHQVEYAIEETDPEAQVRVDPNRFMQVIANLLSNAAKFSPAGQRVSVGVMRREGRVRIEVRDRGPGISPEFRNRIFQKFAQADSSDTRKKGGTGLGLNITKSIVERMGGQIGFESQPEVLTTFFVELPLVDVPSAGLDAVASAPAPASEGQDDPSPASDGGVLICEDDADIASLLRMLLQQGGLRADVALSAAQAKAKLAAGRYRAMTVDLDLPDQSGVELIRELRASEATRELPIVVVSAYVDDGRKALLGEAFSVAEFIEKPIDEDKLGAAMRQALRGGGAGARPQVLHVEDDPDIATLVRTLAGDLADVVCAASVGQAKALLARQHFDLAILDLTLPDGDGMKLVPLLNGASPPVPVVVFSAQEVTRDQVAQQRLKAALLKSRTDDTELLDTIRRLIGDTPHLSQGKS